MNHQSFLSHQILVTLAERNDCVFSNHLQELDYLWHHYLDSSWIPEDSPVFWLFQFSPAFENGSRYLPHCSWLWHIEGTKPVIETNELLGSLGCPAGPATRGCGTDGGCDHWTTAMAVSTNGGIPNGTVKKGKHPNLTIFNSGQQLANGWEVFLIYWISILILFDVKIGILCAFKK